MLHRLNSPFIGLGLVAILAAPPAGYAQAAADQAAARVPDTYQRGYFADGVVANAYDMLLRIPGFHIVEADADVRGYAAALGNVLIDGAHPSSKRESIETLLQRIPADAVARIELLRDGAAGMDMGGHAVLANVIRVRDAAVESALALGGAASTDGWAAPQGEYEYTRRRGERVLELALQVATELDDDSGRGKIHVLAPDGALLEQSLLDARATEQTQDASVGWRQPMADGMLEFDVAWRGETSEARNSRLPYAAPGLAAGLGEHAREREDFREFEAGLRLERNIDEHNTLRLTASQQLGWLDAREIARESGSVESFEEATDSGESIARIDFVHAWSPALSFDAALEGAFNFLQSKARLRSDDAPVPLPGSDVRIEERRLLASAGATWQPTDSWMLEAGLQVERSRIAQSGDASLQRQFTYLKPRFTLQRELNQRNRLRLSLSREVGQLDFGDFVASAALETDQLSAGNAALAPDRSWRLAVAWEHRFDNDAAFVATMVHDRISDVIDRVMVADGGERFDAPGNIGDGRRRTLSLDFSAPLDRLGFGGARIRSSLLWRHSQVTDPVTGRQRPISGSNPFEGSILLVQDLPALRLQWGVELQHIGKRETEYRFDEITRESEDAGWTLFAERRIGARWRIRAEATDLFGRDFVERREQHDGPRSIRPLAQIERRERVMPGYFSLSFRRSMGD